MRKWFIVIDSVVFTILKVCVLFHKDQSYMRYNYSFLGIIILNNLL